MLLFIGVLRGSWLDSISVSIHHMLLFIAPAFSADRLLLCFNTSHVTLYRFRVFLYTWHYFVSIHHMLLFINFNMAAQTLKDKFQYITCYSLSGPHSPLQLKISGFNTSHVTLYRRTQPWEDYFLFVSIHHMLLFIRRTDNQRGIRKHVSIHHMLLFICKPGKQSSPGGQVSIHHMLLFISLITNRLLLKMSFNTSHVTLYR